MNLTSGKVAAYDPPRSPTLDRHETAARRLEAGTHRLALDAVRLAAGVYVVRASVAADGTAARTFTQRVTVVR